jgi:hypothetical protein
VKGLWFCWLKVIPAQNGEFSVTDETGAETKPRGLGIHDGISLCYRPGKARMTEFSKRFERTMSASSCHADSWLAPPTYRRGRG